MSKAELFDAVFIGNYTKDTIISPSGTRYVDGGAINYSAHAAAALGYKAAVVTRLAREDTRVVDGFTKAGIECLVTYSPASTTMLLEYPTTDPDIRNLSVASTAGSISASDLGGLNARAAVIGPSLRGEVGLDVVQALHVKGMLVAADMQGYVRVLRGESLIYEPWNEMAVTLQNLDILKSDAVEAEFLTGEKDIEKAARFYASLGPREIVLTHRNGVLIYAAGEYHHFEFHSESLDGRSGRGDTCIGTYVVKRLDLSPYEAGKWAAAVTSLKVERLGTFNREIGEVEAFIHKYYPNGTH
jgi:sugar/nucleoside kinase (ribokinase family)